MTDILDIALRSIISIMVLFILTKLLGKRQLSQLTFFDYIIGISIGSIAAAMSVEQDIPYHICVIAMVVYAIIALGISLLTDKSIKARRLFSGTSIILIDKGKIIGDNLKKSKFDINELLSECRCSGYFNVADIEYAVMEINGKISFLPKSDKRPLCVEDMNVQATQDELVSNVIMSGKVMINNLIGMGLNREWLDAQLKAQHIHEIGVVFLGTVDCQNKLSLYFKGEKPRKYNLFE